MCPTLLMLSTRSVGHVRKGKSWHAWAQSRGGIFLQFFS